jgi:hypothetical protein
VKSEERSNLLEVFFESLSAVGQRLLEIRLAKEYGQEETNEQGTRSQAMTGGEGGTDLSVEVEQIERVEGDLNGNFFRFDILQEGNSAE